MIVVRLTHGAGNQLFQYACARSLALRRGDTLRLDPCFYSRHSHRSLVLDRLPVKGRLLDPVPLHYEGRTEYAVRLPRGIHKYTEPGRGFHEELFALSAPHIYLDGYFQSEKYFALHVDPIRAELSLDGVPGSVELEHRIGDVTSVSVHVRRTDYVGQGRYDILGSSYYERAMARMRDELDRPRFFVFSDDIAYCRTMLPADDCEHIEARDALTDLRLMARCRHHIIANSSFSWWGAWLDPRADTRTLAPAQWFEPADEASIDDVLPSGWERIPR